MEAKVLTKSADHVEEKCRIGVYVCHCGLNIAQTVDCKKVSESAGLVEDVIVSKDMGYACSEPGQREIKDDIIEYGLDRVVLEQRSIERLTFP